MTGREPGTCPEFSLKREIGFLKCCEAAAKQSQGYKVK
jgi:hypothetical protein